MQFKSKLRRIGNSLGVITPSEVITGYREGDVITLSIEGDNVITRRQGSVITKPSGQKKIFNTEPCPKHPGSMKGTCGCK